MKQNIADFCVWKEVHRKASALLSGVEEEISGPVAHDDNDSALVKVWKTELRDIRYALDRMQAAMETWETMQDVD